MVHCKHDDMTSFLSRYVEVIMSLVWEVGLDNAEQLNFTCNGFPVKLKDIDRLERLKPEIHANLFGSEDTKINRLIIS